MSNNIIGLNGAPLNTSSTVTGGYVALGYLGNASVVFSLIQGRVVQLRPSNMNEMTLKSVFGAQWCDQHYLEFHEKKEELVFNHKRLATDVITQCQAAGLYEESSERRCGVWPSSNGEKLIVNSDELWTNDGEALEGRAVEGKIYPKSGSVGFQRDTASASEKDVDRVLRFFGSMNWKNDMVPEMLLGWFVCAVLAPSLARRPHVFITAEAGSGKTVLLDALSEMLGSLNHKFTGLPTKAGLYQTIGGTTRSVIIDEAEVDTSPVKWKDTLTIARNAYSQAEADSGIIVGTPGGTSKSYRFCAPFLAAGISPGKFEPADLSRWAIFEALKRDQTAGSALPSMSEFRELGARLAVKAVRQWSVLQASLEVIRDAVQLNGGDARLADTVGPLLAGYWVMVSDKAATQDDAQTLVGLCGLGRYVEQREESDHVRCLEALISRVLPLPRFTGEYVVRQPMSIGEAITSICENPTGSLELQHRLTQLGLRVALQKGRWVLMVANSADHAELRKLFRGTKWQHGGWSLTLRRLPGGEESTQRLGAGYKSSKVTMFDIPAELLPVCDESELLAA